MAVDDEENPVIITAPLAGKGAADGSEEKERDEKEKQDGGTAEPSSNNTGSRRTSLRAFLSSSSSRRRSSFLSRRSSMSSLGDDDEDEEQHGAVSAAGRSRSGSGSSRRSSLKNLFSSSRRRSSFLSTDSAKSIASIRSNGGDASIGSKSASSGRRRKVNRKSSLDMMRGKECQWRPRQEHPLLVNQDAADETAKEPKVSPTMNRLSKSLGAMHSSTGNLRALLEKKGGGSSRNLGGSSPKNLSGSGRSSRRGSMGQKLHDSFGGFATKKRRSSSTGSTDAKQVMHHSAHG